MRVLVTGAGGQLGAAVLDACPSAVGLTRAELDVTSADAVRDAITGDDLVVINCSAYTAVDAAETAEADAHLVNAVAPGLLASACAAVGASLIHVSTDYVFSGTGTRPYEVTDPTGPRTAYGRTKLAGEQAVLTLHPTGSRVVRTAWLYGGRGPSFVHTMARLEAGGGTISVVDDQIGSPTYAGDLAAGLLALADSSAPPGIYHGTNAGATSWYGFARAIFDELGADPDRVLPTDTAGYPRPAPRPAYSVLSPTAWTDAGLPPLRDWRTALTAAFATDPIAFRP